MNIREDLTMRWDREAERFVREAIECPKCGDPIRQTILESPEEVHIRILSEERSIFKETQLPKI